MRLFDRARSRCWVPLSRFCKVLRAHLGIRMALWRGILAPPGLHWGSTEAGRWQKWQKVGQNGCASNGPVPHRYGSSTHVVEFPGTPGHWGADCLPPSRAVGSSSPSNQDFLLMPGIILFVSVVFPRGSQDLLGQFGWIAAPFCFILFLTYQGKYIHEWITAHWMTKGKVAEIWALRGNNKVWKHCLLHQRGGDPSRQWSYHSGNDGDTHNKLIRNNIFLNYLFVSFLCDNFYFVFCDFVVSFQSSESPFDILGKQLLIIAEIFGYRTDMKLWGDRLEADINALALVLSPNFGPYLSETLMIWLMLIMYGSQIVSLLFLFSVGESKCWKIWLHCLSKIVNPTSQKCSEAHRLPWFHYLSYCAVPGRHHCPQYISSWYGGQCVSLHFGTICHQRICLFRRTFLLLCWFWSSQCLPLSHLLNCQQFSCL